MRVLVLEGGESSEREVSLLSAAAVASALKQAGHDMQRYDTQNGLGGLEAYQNKVDVVLPILHGSGGEDGEVQSALEKLGMKFLGAGSQVSRTCFDKVAFKRAIVKLDALMPEWERVTAETILHSRLVSKPFVLKPISGGSSIDMFIVRDPSAAPDYRQVFEKYEYMLLEELIEGQEITVPVLGNKALPVIEIIPPQGQEFDYENKYNGKTQELCPPLNISASIQLRAQRLSETIHTSLGVRDLSRIDFMVRGDALYVLELNTMPGLTDTSLFPKSAAAAGIDMTELADRLLRMTINQDKAD